jgi:site-specific DNA-methyltransferase (adenine-specific)
MTTLEITYKAIKDLIPYVNNSRTHSDEQVTQVASSIKEFGFTNPILLDGESGIIAGHGRLLAAKKLGMEQVPTIELSHLTDAQKKAYVIADNKLALNAGWDNEILALELKDLADLGYDLGLTGFDPDEIEALNPIKVNEGLTDDDEVPEPPPEPITKPGDIYKLGKHRLMCGDSCSTNDMEKLCDGQMVDMWLTDPPYNVAYEGGTGLTIKNDDMGDEQFRQFLRDACVTADIVMKSGAVFYIWYADVETYNFTGAVKDAGWKMSQILIWKKSSLIMGRKDYHFIHEPCLYGWKEGAAHLWASDRKQTTIFEFDKPKKNGEHPTMKPVALFEYQMLNNTKGGDIVLDSFGGSGTTMIAAEKNGRTAYLMELDPKYCDVIVRRWEDFTGKKAELLTNA